MPPRSSWKGFIKLSLVSVPVKAYTANATGSEIRLNQLHAACNSRIKYQKICPVHGEVSNDEIVSGYEFAKGQYVVIDLDELSKLRKESDKSIAIDGFIPEDEIDPVYFSGRTHYLVPDGPVGQKPYALLREGMRGGELVAIGHIVLSGKEQLVLVRAMEGMLAVNVLLYPNRVKKSESFKDEISDSALTDEEMKLTKTLIDASTISNFNFDTYTDEYTEKLTTLIQHKVEGKEIVEVADAEEPKIINLMEALKASIAHAQGGGSGSKKSEKSAKKSKATKKMAPSETGASTTRKKKSG